MPKTMKKYQNKLIRGPLQEPLWFGGPQWVKSTPSSYLLSSRQVFKRVSFESGLLEPFLTSISARDAIYMPKIMKKYHNKPIRGPLQEHFWLGDHNGLKAHLPLSFEFETHFWKVPFESGLLESFLTSNPPRDAICMPKTMKKLPIMINYGVF